MTVSDYAYEVYKTVQPCNATVEKQNCGVSLVGGEDACVMMMAGGGI